MTTIFRKTLLVAITAAAAVMAPGTASAQAAKATVEKPSFDDLQSPEFGGGKQKSFKPKDWLEVETKLKISMRPEPQSKTCERMTVKWYVAVKHPDKRGAFMLLTKEVNHVNVPLEEDIYSSVYLSPASLQRLGFARGGKAAVEYVGYEVLVNGEKVGEETSKGKVGWWNTSSDNISRSESIPLLNKMETPFANMWWDRYAEVQVERR